MLLVSSRFFVYENLSAFNLLRSNSIWKVQIEFQAVAIIHIMIQISTKLCYCCKMHNCTRCVSRSGWGIKPGSPRLVGSWGGEPKKKPGSSRLVASGWNAIIRPVIRLLKICYSKNKSYFVRNDKTIFYNPCFKSHKKFLFANLSLQ